MCFNPGDIVRERYRIIRRLGQGGFGTTYLAEDTRDDAADSVTDYSAFEIVLKQIKLSPADDDRDNRDTGYLNKLELEANILKRLSFEYAYIPKCFSSFYEGNYYYIVQEYIAGLDLTHEIQPGTKLTEAEAVDILDKILSILSYVHQNKIIHRDIKPANIIRRESNNQLVLIDFGAVKEIATRQTNDLGQQRTRMIYTQGYTPLEQFDGNPQFNSDIYALGMTIMRSVTGFSTKAICDPSKIPRKDGEGNYNWSKHAPQISSELKAIISQMIKSRFRERYQSADEIIARLKTIEDSTTNKNNLSNSDRGAFNSQNLVDNALDAASTSTSINSRSQGERDSNANKYNSGQNSSIDRVTKDTVLLSENDNRQQVNIEGRQSSIPPHQPKANFLSRKKIKFAVIILISCLAAILFSLRGIPLISNLMGSKNVCSLNLDDRLSCGEEILDPFAKSAVRANGAEKYEQKKYGDAFKYFQKSWQKSRDAETLIYLNNALLDANRIKSKTISVAVPFSSDEAKEIKSSAISQDFLRGVAQAQTEVNLSLSKSSLEIAKGLEQYKFLPYRAINQNSDRGLKIIIADDANQKQQAEEIATKLAQNKHNLGIIGHYTSKITLDTVDIYEQNDLAQISYGTTTKELSEGQKNNFFRVVYTTREEAEALVSYIDRYDLEAKNIAIFYNPSSDYSFDFKESIEQKIAELNNPNINIVETFDLADDLNFATSLAMSKLDDDRGINICLLLPDGQISNSLARAIEVIQADNGQRLMLGGNPLINPKVSKIKTEQPPNLIVSTFWHPTADRSSSFKQQTQKLWGENVSGGTTMAYDAALAMIEAIREQQKPSRKGTIERLRNEDFAVAKAATGTILFNTPKNGDRLDFYPTLVRLHRCESGKQEFVSLSLDDSQALDSICQTDRS